MQWSGSVSSLLLPKTHIDALVTSALIWSDGRTFGYYFDDWWKVTPDTATRTGSMLWELNKLNALRDDDEDDLPPGSEFDVSAYSFSRLPGEFQPTGGTAGHQLLPIPDGGSGAVAGHRGQGVH